MKRRLSRFAAFGDDANFARRTRAKSENRRPLGTRFISARCVVTS